MNIDLKHISLVALRWLLGGVFIFSGLVKCVDPVGTSIFVEKYLATYSLEAMLYLALPIAVLLATLEVMLGILLIIGVLRKCVTFSVTILLLLFTIITLLSATVLPIGDCGCFGDAVKLTPWQTFAKNVVLLTVALLLLRNTEDRHHVWSRGVAVVVAAVSLPLAINLYSLRYLPLVDFLSYKVGVDLRAAVASERESDDVKSILVFRNSATGETLEFPADDTACWTNPDIEYVDARTVTTRNSEGEFADFAVYNNDGVDLSLELLSRGGRVAWLCVNDVEALNGTRLQYVERLFEAYPEHAIVVLTAADRAFVSRRLGREVHNVDAMTLRSMMRADVGVVVITDGVIEYKADIRDI